MVRERQNCTVSGPDMPQDVENGKRHLFGNSPEETDSCPSDSCPSDSCRSDDNEKETESISEMKTFEAKPPTARRKSSIRRIVAFVMDQTEEVRVFKILYRYILDTLYKCIDTI